MRVYQQQTNINDPIHFFVAKDYDSKIFGWISYKIIDGNKKDLFDLDLNFGIFYFY